jgi:hypothetical protein
MYLKYVNVYIHIWICTYIYTYVGSLNDDVETSIGPNNIRLQNFQIYMSEEYGQECEKNIKNIRKALQI